jgi:hypothetical protein
MFSYKVDIDVLGTANTMRVMSLVPTTYDAPWFDVPQTRPLPVVHTVRNESESTFVPDYNAPMTYMFVNQGQKNAYLSPMPSTRRARAHMMMLMLMAMAMVMASRYGADRGYKFHSTSYVKHLYGDIMGESASWANYHIAVVKRKEEEPTINNVYAQARPYDPSISGRRQSPSSSSQSSPSASSYSSCLDFTCAGAWTSGCRMRTASSRRTWWPSSTWA